MLQKIYLTKVIVTKQRSWFFAFTETCIKAIYKITVAR